MSDARTVQNCRWAEPTLFLVSPLWTAAEDYPWSCRRDGAPAPVSDPTACQTCPRWEPREAEGRRESGTAPKF
jgi:hypothetical protein